MVSAYIMKKMPHLTEAGAKELAAAAEALATLGARSDIILARATENLAAKFAPSRITTLVVGGGLVLLGFGWLAFAVYKVSKSGREVQHTVAHTPYPPPALPRT